MGKSFPSRSPSKTFERGDKRKLRAIRFAQPLSGVPSVATTGSSAPFSRTRYLNWHILCKCHAVYSVHSRVSASEISRLMSCGNGMPIASISFGYIEIGVKPGMVLTSFRMI